MANIPGIAGYTQPGVFTRDRVISRGVSIPGGIRIVCIMGEGLREETVVASAAGGGADGNSAVSPTGGGDGRFFALANSPVVSGRTELYLNGSPLYGMEDTIDANGFSNAFDFRVDASSGVIELQGASIADQDGINYSASALNVGNGTIYDATCGTLDLIDVIDDTAPPERWTVRTVSVSRDSNGDPIPGRATLTATGSISGQLRDSSGGPILFHSDAFTTDLGAVSANSDTCSDGFIVASSDDWGLGTAVDRTASGDVSPLTTNSFQFNGDLLSQGQVLPGDHLCVDGYTSIEIEEIAVDTGVTTITLTTDSLAVGAETTNVAWDIRAVNLFVDDPSIVHGALTGTPTSEGSFSSSHIGRVLTICGGDSAGRYYIDSVTSSRRVRVSSFEDSSASFPELIDDDADGLAETNLTTYVLETNGVLAFGVLEGTVSLEVGDKFYIDVNSKVLDQGDTLEARYVYVLDLEDPEYFESAQALFNKHGTPSTSNTLSLGSQMCFENGAPAILALQCRPALPRRTSVTLVEEVNANGDGGFSGCNGACEADDLYFPIPRPFTGIVSGRPDVDTQVNIFIVRNGSETQIFPNKVGLYNSQFESDAGLNMFVTSSDTAYSYTVVNTDMQIIAQGDNADISSTDGTFSTLEVDFDSEDIDNGSLIVIQKLETPAGVTLTTTSDIGTYLWGNPALGAEALVTAIVEDSTVTIVANDGVTTVLAGHDASDVQFFIKNQADTTNVAAALLLHDDLVDNGTLQQGDGIRISYIDEADADYYWFNALEALESADCQMVVPLPTQNRSGIFRATVNHCENMSTIAIQKERVALMGAQMGVTAEALVGTEEIAIEDIGVLEGIQGDDPEELLNENTEDLVNFKLNDNFTSKRCVYFYPDQIVRNVNGTNVFIDGFYMAAAASGLLSATQNVAIPLTYKSLSGFSILRDKVFSRTTLNRLGNVGATVVEPIIGGGKVLHGRTTSISGFVEDEEISIIFIRDRVKQVLRQSLKGFLGKVEDENTQGLMMARVSSIMSAMVSQGLITGFDDISVERDKVDPRQWNVFLRFQPAYPINYIFVDIEVGVI